LEETAVSVFYIHNREDSHPKSKWVKQAEEREASHTRPACRPGSRWEFNINIEIREIRQNDLN
jgi:hypothetical protein